MNKWTFIRKSLEDWDAREDAILCAKYIEDAIETNSPGENTLTMIDWFENYSLDNCSLFDLGDMAEMSGTCILCEKYFCTEECPLYSKTEICCSEFRHVIDEIGRLQRIHEEDLGIDVYDEDYVYGVKDTWEG